MTSLVHQSPVAKKLFTETSTSQPYEDGDGDLANILWPWGVVRDLSSTTELGDDHEFFPLPWDNDVVLPVYDVSKRTDTVKGKQITRNDPKYRSLVQEIFETLLAPSDAQKSQPPTNNILAIVSSESNLPTNWKTDLQNNKLPFSHMYQVQINYLHLNHLVFHFLTVCICRF